MFSWIQISLLLCLFGFFREMRPSEPFVTEFISGEWRNVTAEQVSKLIYPFGTYSYAIQLVLVFLVTDILRYKAIIVLSALVGIIMWALMLWTYTLLGLLIVQFFYGTYMAAEVAYYTYIYAKVDREKYQQVTGHTRSAILSGKFLGGLLAQVLVSYELMDLRELNYISFGTQVISLFIAVSLPSVDASLYFYATEKKPATNGTTKCVEPKGICEIEQNNSGDDGTMVATNGNKQDPDEKPKFSWRRAIKLFAQHIVAAYTNRTVVLWSVWWALATAGFLQVFSYIQLLWHQIDGERETFYNGAVEAALTLFSAAAAFCAGAFDSSKYEEWDIWLLAVSNLLTGLCMLWAGLTEHVWVAYVTYIFFGILYYFVVTVASAVVAKHLEDDSFGLIFGINTFCALILQSISTVAVVSESGLGYSPRGLFNTIGGYFLVLAVLYAASGIVRWMWNRKICS